MEHIGYSVVSKAGQEVKFWGDAAGACAGVPDFVDWPSGDRSHCPSLNMDNNGAKFVRRMLDISEGDAASENIAFDGKDIVVTRVLLRPPVPEPHEPTQIDYQAAIRDFVNDAARARSYDNGVSLAGYVTSTVPQWATEAQAFVAWRDKVWVYALEQLTLVQEGQRPQPTPLEFIAELPTIAWPT